MKKIYIPINKKERRFLIVLKIRALKILVILILFGCANILSAQDPIGTYQNPFFLCVDNVAFKNSLPVEVLYGACTSSCAGRLGENIFLDGDFGSGVASILPFDPGIAPGYQYTTSPPPADGFYCITNNTSNFGSFAATDWIDIQDNGPEINGYMMVVNASNQPGIFYQKTVTVCESTLYEFSIDIISMLESQLAGLIQPNLAFLIDGNQVCESGNIPADEQWRTLRFSFTTLPGQTTVTLALRNNAPGGAGNDLAIDNISFRACGPEIILPVVVEFCREAPILLSAQVDNSPYPNIVYQWQVFANGSWQDIQNENSQSIAITNPIDGSLYRLLSANSVGNLALSSCRVASEQIELKLLSDPIGNASVQNISCFGLADGSISATITGGTMPFSYQWSNGATTFSIQSLTADTYTLIVTDANGCTSETSAVVSDVAPINVIEKTTDVSCNGIANGTITIGVTGGTAPFLYQWSNGATSSDLIGLSAGTYTVTLTDNNQCSLVASANIVEPTPITIGTTQYSISCFGKSDGYIASTVTGGVGPYIYYWSEKSITSDIDSLPAGIYELTITDAQGCTATTYASMTEPPLLTLVATEVAITCYGAGNGAASAIASGGTGPYNYLWSNGASGASITNLSPGIYILTATDSKGCTALVSSDITEPAVLSSTINASNTSCFGVNDGFLTTISAGGTLPYTYQWSNGLSNASIINLPAGTYVLTLTDDNGCSGVFSSTVSEPALLSVISDAVDINCNGNSNGIIAASGSGGTLPYNYQWSNGATTSTINGLSPQHYTLTLTDGNGCRAKSSATITEPMLLSGLATETDVLCNGGNNGLVSVVCSGGTLPYNYLWSNGSTESQTSGLIAGTYNLTVTDEQGCSKVITSIISDPPLLSVGTSTSNVICHAAANGSVSATTTGGTLPYNYQWSNGDNNPTASGLPSGAYALTVTDGNGCQITTSAFVTQPPLLSLISTGSPVSCNGGANGAVSIIASGGTLPYSYQWSNGSNNPLINNIPAGTYSIIVTDNNGCTTLLSTFVNEPPLLISNISTIEVACNGEDTGAASVTTGGGTPPYQYQWYNGMTSAIVDELKAGAYTLTITDNNFCTAIETVTITEPSLLSSLADRTDASCRGFTDGAVEILASGGTAPYEYIWSTGDDQAFIENLAAGTYWLTLTDSNGCSLVETVDIIEAHLLTVGLGDDKVLSLGEALELEVASNLNPNEVAQFTWISSSDTLRCKDCVSYSDLPLKSGCLTVFVESIYGCTESAAVCYDIEALRRVYVPNAFNPDGGGENARVTLFSDRSVVNVKKMMFFDRWGTLVYSAENILPNSEVEGWDGTYRGSMMANGVYVWVAEVEYVDGRTEVLQGDTTLIR
jgi:gliding motility-associated-like protein